MVTSSTKTVVAFATEKVDLSCIATATNTVDIKWRKKASDYTEQNKKYDDLTASQGNYDPSTNTRKSTFTLTSPTAADTSDSIECYDATIGISGVMTLEVIGMIFFFNSSMLIPYFDMRQTALLKEKMLSVNMTYSCFCVSVSVTQFQPLFAESTCFFLSCFCSDKPLVPVKYI
jgi:hypothetical protein